MNGKHIDKQTIFASSLCCVCTEKSHELEKLGRVDKKLSRRNVAQGSTRLQSLPEFDVVTR